MAKKGKENSNLSYKLELESSNYDNSIVKVLAAGIRDVIDKVGPKFILTGANIECSNVPKECCGSKGRVRVIKNGASQVCVWPQQRENKVKLVRRKENHCMFTKRRSKITLKKNAMIDDMWDTAAEIPWEDSTTHLPVIGTCPCPCQTNYPKQTIYCRDASGRRNN